jgi:hypothetical protein
MLPLDQPMLILDRRVALNQIPLMILVLKTTALPPGKENNRTQKKGNKIIERKIGINMSILKQNRNFYYDNGSSNCLYS